MNTLRDKTYEEMSYTEKAMVHVDNYQYDKAMVLISITQAEAMERQAAAQERIAAVLELVAGETGRIEIAIQGVI